MNIFAHVIFTSHPLLKEILIERLEVEFQESIWELNIYKKITPSGTTLLLSSPAKDFEDAVQYAKDHFDILKFLCIWMAVPVDSLDLKMGDIIVPNTFINTKNEAVFSEYVIDKNYDFHAFGLVLNGICLSLEAQIQTEDELAQIKEDFACEVMDFEAFFQMQTLQKYEIWDKSVLVKSIGSTKEELTHGVDILTLMME